MNSKLKPAIIGGVIVGLLSAIPFVNLANICCCLWALLGGAIASYVYIKGSPIPVKAGDGAVLGVLAGVVGAVIYVIIGIPLGILAGAAMVNLMAGWIEGVNPDQARMMREMQATQTIIATIIRGIIFAILLIAFSTIGGLLGVAIFEKRKGDSTPPAPPQNYA